MGKLDVLKNQNPNYVINVIDVIHDLVKKPKYVELVLALSKYRDKSGHTAEDRLSLINELHLEYGLNLDYLESKTFLELRRLGNTIHTEIGYNETKSILKFIELNERGLIAKKDLSTYRTIDDVALEISLAELNLVGKEMEKQVIKLMSTDEWLVLKPLTYLSSVKYGASTKWCVSAESNPDHFYRYVKRGVLIFVINKKTGEKTAAFKNLDSEYDRETSFWDMADQRIDSLDCNFTPEILTLIKSEFSSAITNWECLSEADRNRELIWLESQQELKKELVAELPDEPRPLRVWDDGEPQDVAAQINPVTQNEAARNIEAAERTLNELMGVTNRGEL